MSTADYWIALESERDGLPTWHRFRHMPSGAGGTYGWWQICGPEMQGPFCGHPSGIASPPKGSRVCRRCRKGVGRWEESEVPSLGEVIRDIFQESA